MPFDELSELEPEELAEALIVLADLLDAYVDEHVQDPDEYNSMMETGAGMREASGIITRLEGG